MARNQQVYQPHDDVNASSSTSNYPVNAYWDENLSSQASEQERMSIAYGSGEAAGNNAQPFVEEAVGNNAQAFVTPRFPAIADADQNPSSQTNETEQMSIAYGSGEAAGNNAQPFVDEAAGNNAQASITPPFPAVAYADQNPSSQTNESVPADNHAEAFHGNRVYQDPNQGIDNCEQRGPVIERLALFDDRPLDDLHLGKVSAVANKLLLKDLLQVIVLTNIQRNEVDQKIDRKCAVSTLLKIWKLNGNRKTVADLIQLLQQAGGGRYTELINTLQNTPP